MKRLVQIAEFGRQPFSRDYLSHLEAAGWELTVIQWTE
jgi:hypothetical protein